MARVSYHVCKFPSVYGTPWKTRWLLVALVYALLRRFGSPGVIEIHRHIHGEEGG